MKPTKNQADAVRSYLSAIGHDITHVQALEVIARGNGFRSRHVKGMAAASAPVPTPGACKQCGTTLVRGYCKDGTCVYSDWPQFVEREDVFSMSTLALEAKYKVAKRNPEDDRPVDLEALGVALGRELGFDNNHPVFTRDEWRSATEIDQIPYWTWVAAKLTYGDDFDNVPHDYCLAVEAEGSFTQTYTYGDAATREDALLTLLASCASEKNQNRVTIRFFDYNPAKYDSARYYGRGEVQAVVSRRGIIEYRGKTFFTPEFIESADGKTRFVPGTGGVKGWPLATQTRPAAPEATLCRYNLLWEVDNQSPDVCSYSTPKEREDGLRRLLAKAVLAADGYPRRYWLYEREVQVGDELFIPENEKGGAIGGRLGVVTAINDQSREFTVDIHGKATTFEFEMLSLMTLSRAENLAVADATKIMHVLPDSAVSKGGHVRVHGVAIKREDLRIEVLEGQHYLANK